MGSSIVNNIPVITTGTTKFVNISGGTAYVSTLKGNNGSLNIAVNNLSFTQDPNSLQSGGYDSSFVVGGGFSAAPTFVTEISSKMYYAGLGFTFYNNIQGLGSLVSLNDDGSKNTSFNPAAFTGNISKLLIDSNNKIIATGTFTAYSGSTNNRIIRLNSDGTKDTSFNVGTGFNSQTNKAVVQSDGKYVVIGNYTTFTGTSQGRIIRLTTTGAKDTTYAIGTGFNANPACAVIQSDDKVIVGGSFTTFTGSTQNRIIRLTTTGHRDTTFAVGTAFNSTVTEMAIDSNGKIYVGGSFTTFTGATQNRIIRLNSNGSVDNGFVTGTGLNGSVTTLMIDSNGKILVAGTFTSYNGTSVTGGLIRLNTNGTLDNTFTAPSWSAFGSTGTTAPTINTIAQRSNGNYVVASSNLIATIATGNRRKFVAEITSTGSFVNSLTIKNSGFIGNTSGIGVNVIRSLSTNKILVGGGFITYNDNTFGTGLVRLNSDATLDTSFLNLRPNSTIRDIQVISGETKYLIGGGFTGYNLVTAQRLAKINSDGTLDTSFVTTNGFDSDVFAIKQSSVFSTGKLYIGGQFSGYTGVMSPAIVRLLPNATIDTTFKISQLNNAYSGGTNLDSIWAGPVSSIYEQTDGKIIITGNGGFQLFDDGDILPGKIYNNNIALRLTTGGTVDLTYGYPSGMTLTFNTQTLVSVKQSDGHIVFGGDFTRFDTNLIGGAATAVTISNIFRLTSAGLFDSVFNHTVGFGFNGIVTAINNDTDGGLLVCGNFTSFNGHACNGFVKLNSDGSYNPSLIVGTGFPLNPLITTVQPYRNEYLIGGGFSSYQNNTSTDLVLIGGSGSGYTINIPGGLKYTSDISSVFTSFSIPHKQYVDNSITTFISGATNGISKNGRLIKLGGNLTGATTIGLGVNSLTFTGTSATLKYGSDLSSVYTSRSLVDRGYIDTVVGSGTTIVNSVNFTSNFGTVDPLYKYRTGTTFNDQILYIIYQSDGKIIAGGNFTTFNGSSQNRLIRLNNNGSKDTTFSIGTGFNANVLAIAQQSDGKIIVGGQFTSYSGVTKNCIVRLNTNGTIDSTFIIGSGFNLGGQSVNAVLIQPDGKIIVGGQFLTYSGGTVNGIVRLNTNGSKDTTFSTGTAFGTSPSVISMALQKDGKILVGLGGSGTYSGTSVNQCLRLNSNGSLDTSFAFNNTGFNFGVQYIALQSTGKILLGGNYGSSPTSGSIRFNSDGSRDTTFDTGGGFDGQVRQIVVLPDDRVIAVGGFSHYDGNAVNNYFLSLNKNGGIDTSLSGGTLSNVVNAVALGTTDNTICIGGQFLTLNGVSYARFVKLNTYGYLTNRNVLRYLYDNSRFFTSPRFIPDVGYITGTTYLTGVTTDIKIGTVGKGLYVKQGANATFGRITLTGGTAVVSTTKITSISNVQLTTQSLGTVTSPKAIAVTARTAGTSFTITSADNTDTSVVSWWIVEPA